MVTVFDRLAPDDGGDGGGAPLRRPAARQHRLSERAPGRGRRGGRLGARTSRAGGPRRARGGRGGSRRAARCVPSVGNDGADGRFAARGVSLSRRRRCPRTGAAPASAAELPPRLAASDTMPLVLLTLATLRWLAEPIADAPITLATGVPVRAAGAPVRLRARRARGRRSSRGPRRARGRPPRAGCRAVPTGSCSPA